MRAASAAKHALYQLKFEDDWNDDQWMHGRKFLSQKLLSISHNCKAIFFNKEINHATNWNNITLPNYVQCMQDINILHSAILHSSNGKCSHMFIEDRKILDNKVI